MSALELEKCIAVFTSDQSSNRSNPFFVEAIALHLGGSNEEALSRLEHVETGPLVASLELTNLRIHCLLELGRLDEAEKLSHELFSAAEDLDSASWIGRALAHLAGTNRERGHVAYAENLATRALDLLRKTGDLTGCARSCYQLAYCLLLQGKVEASQREFESAIALARLSEDPVTEATAQRRLAFFFLEHGEYDAAIRSNSRAVELFESIGATWKATQGRYGLAIAHIRLGDFDEARKLLELIRDEYLRGDHTLRSARWHLAYAWLAIHEESSEVAVQHLNYALKVFSRVKAQREVALCYEYFGDAHCLSGRFEEALNAYDKAGEVGRRVSPTADVVVESTRKSANVFILMGLHVDATRRIRHARRLISTFLDPYELAWILRLRGELKVARGRRGGRELLEQASEAFARIKARHEVGALRRVVDSLRERETPVSNKRTRPSLRRSEFEVDGNREGIVSRDSRVLRALEVAVRAAPLDLPILIFGETGTGKELFATLAHRHSGRTGSFLAINCAALPPDILDAELFGHAKGAYTGAYRDRPGLVEAASDGTLFLDEIGEMSLAVQGRLLRALEAKEIRRLGENQARKVNTRFVGATHRNLEEMVKEGKFRADLFFRLKGVIVTLPPLRERPEDVSLLTDYFLSQAGIKLGRALELTSEARALLRSHPWPGNVRELRSVIERASAMSEPGFPIRPEDLGLERIRVSGSLEEHLEDEERRRLTSILDSVDWNQSKAARILRLKRTTLVGKLKRLGIDRPPKK